MEKLIAAEESLKTGLTLIKEALAELQQASPLIVSPSPALRQVAEWVTASAPATPHAWDGETVSLLGSDLTLLDAEDPTENEEEATQEAKETERSTGDAEMQAEDSHRQLQITRTVEQPKKEKIALPQAAIAPPATERIQAHARLQRPHGPFLRRRNIRFPESPEDMPPTGRFDPNFPDRGLLWDRLPDVRKRPTRAAWSPRACIFCGANHYSDSCQQFRLTRTRKFLRGDYCTRCVSASCMGCALPEEDSRCIYCESATGNGLDTLGQPQHHSAFCDLADRLESWSADLADANPQLRLYHPPRFGRKEIAVLEDLDYHEERRRQERREDNQHASAWDRGYMPRGH